MANEIYPVTWWGDTYYTAWSLTEHPTLPNGEAYINRVESDGGIFETSGCFYTIVSDNPLLFDLVFIYKERVINDSGTMEETICTSDKIHSIANI